MHWVNIKTSKVLSESFEQLLSELLKIYSNLSSTFTDHILNEINDLNAKYFELSETITSTFTNRIFNLNSTNATLKVFEIFND